MTNNFSNKHLNSKKGFFFLSFFILGLSSLIWFVFRTGTKPSRMNYPCQKIAATNTFVFLTWLGAIFGSHLLFVKFRSQFTWRRVIPLIFLIFLTFEGWKYYQVQKINELRAQTFGTGVGHNPGRVVWVHDSDATTGLYTTYWSEVDQSTVDRMMDTAIKSLAGQSSTGSALSKIFPCGVDCTGKKVAIKVNNNNSNWSNSMDANSQTVLAFLRQLTTAEPGVFSPFNEEDIYVYDVSRWMGGNNTSGPYFTTSIKKDFPRVQLVGRYGANGGQSATMSAETFSYDSDYCTPTELSSMLVPQLIAEADYIVNMPLLKEHGFWPVGGTLSFKNFLGNVNSITGNVSGSNPNWISSGLHACLATTVVNNPEGLVAIYSAGFTDTSSRNLGQTTLDQKVVLTIGDGIYGNQNNNTGPPRDWGMFGGDSPNSLFVSQDVVAVDSVMYDVLMQERGGFIDEGQRHLHAAATRSVSLGVHEHSKLKTGCNGKDDLNCWDYQAIDFVKCDYQAAEIDIRCDGTESNPLTGDLNNDGVVDRLDVAELLNNWGSNFQNSKADVSPDGKINGVDFSLLIKNWGS